jgi:hypothetical protein
VESTPVVFESQLDWLTCSVASAAKSETLALTAHRLTAEEVLAGARVTPFRLNGYLGWQAGRVRFGEREDRALIQLSGDLAEQHFRNLYGRADHITRLDLAVTVRLPRHSSQLGQDHYWQACDHHLLHPTSALPASHQDGNGGYTCYVGDRSSDYFLRIYDKQAESIAQADLPSMERYQNAWRYELEVKGVSAPGVAERMFDSPHPSGTVRGLVHNYCVSHGITPIWNLETPEVPLPGFRRRSDRETRLAWLERSVKPALRWLFEQGDRTEVLERLGLNDIPGGNPGSPPSRD